jgi:hypothetical protein
VGNKRVHGDRKSEWRVEFPERRRLHKESLTWNMGTLWCRGVCLPVSRQVSPLKELGFLTLRRVVWFPRRGKPYLNGYQMSGDSCCFLETEAIEGLRG